jgi:hypothetical protein
MDFEDEIEVLENVLSNLEAARIEVLDSPYHSYLAQSWELDIEEIQSRLDELYELQGEQWEKEIQQQDFEFERSVI